MPLNLQRDWTGLVGKPVVIRLNHAVVRRGVVDAVMPDGSVLWIFPDGTDPREMVEKAEGFQVWSYD